MNLVELFGSKSVEGYVLAIRKTDDRFGDDPASVRWRASWDKGWDGKVMGIRLDCYPVLRVTPKGAWIDPEAYHHGQWVTNEDFKKWVSNDGGQAWAKPTQEQALSSIAIRYARWASRIINDADYFISASRALRFLMPEKARLVKESLQAYSEFVSGMAK